MRFSCWPLTISPFLFNLSFQQFFFFCYNDLRGPRQIWVHDHMEKLIKERLVFESDSKRGFQHI